MSAEVIALKRQVACQQVAIGAMAFMLHGLFDIPIADLVELTELTEFEIRSHARTIKTELDKEFTHV